jgi:hypothetical protein
MSSIRATNETRWDVQFYTAAAWHMARSCSCLADAEAEYVQWAGLSFPVRLVQVETTVTVVREVKQPEL